MSDINFYLSGGAANTSPNLALGGSMSNVKISNSANNLFSKLSKSESEHGGTAYRCIYLSNESSETLYDLKFWAIDSTSSSEIQLGTKKMFEIQNILISGQPVGGTFSLNYTRYVGDTPFTQSTSQIQFTPDLNVLAINVQSALNDLLLITDVVVTAEWFIFDSKMLIVIIFAGADGYSKQELLAVSQNNILGTNPSISISRIQEGHPINAIAPTISFENQTPSGIIFDTYTSENLSLEINELEPFDKFYLWIKRITSTGTKNSIEQSIDIKMSALSA